MTTTILGIAAYPLDEVWTNVDLLARSVARNARDVELILITARLGARDRDLFREFGVRAIELSNPVPKFDQSTEAGRIARHRWTCEMYGARHSWYLTALKEVSSTHVLLSDTRDVVLTGGLSSVSAADRLVLSQENVDFSIESDYWDRKWVLDAYGEDGLRRIGQNRILCAGVVFGPLKDMQDYAEAMSREVRRVGAERIKHSGDQPLHNYLAHIGGIPRFSVSSAESGWMKSIGLMPPTRISFDWDRVTDPPNGERTLVLHQYDRHIRSRKMSASIKRMTGIAWWKSVYAPFDPHPVARLSRMGRRLLGRGI